MRLEDKPLKTWVCTDHDGRWVGVASVVLAETKGIAERLLRAELNRRGLNGNVPFTLKLLEGRQAVVLQDGDY